MSKGQRKFKSNLWQLILIPTLGTLFLIAGGLYYLTTSQLEKLTTDYQILHYQIIILIVTASFIFVGISAFLGVLLYYRITTPLSEIKNTVNALSRGRLDERVPQQTFVEFSELADTINTMAGYMESLQTDMQSHIDHAIQDLHETMETIEIQNAELDLARKEALEASRVKSEFLANTSHEIRTPLNGILGFINLMLKTSLSKQQQEYVNTIQHSAQNLLTVINGILDFSKIESDKLTLDYAPVPLRQCIEEVLRSKAPEAQEKNQELIATIASEIPKNLLGDALRLKQVLSNLVSNAIKYSDEGNILIRVAQLDRQETQITLKISVIDKGIGLTNEQQDQLFSPFNQADMSTTREHEGTGLGLAICKGLVERMHGEIGVISGRNQGSTFWFSVRLGIDKRQPATLNNLDLSKYRILLCGENQESLAQLNHLICEWKGKTQLISVIHDCFPALRETRKNQQTTDLLILDVSPNERKLPPALLNNLAEQLRLEFNCMLFVCCTPIHQQLFHTIADQSKVIFINKPITYDNLHRILQEKFDLYVRDIRAQKNTETAKAKMAVMVVDDNTANLQLASELLRDLDVEVTQAGSGHQALEAFKNHSFNLVLMDIQMPGMDGIETTRQIRLLERGKTRTPIVALTAHTITDQKTDLLIAGMDDCISKPVDQMQLSHIINRWSSLDLKKESDSKKEPGNKKEHEKLNVPNQSRVTNNEISNSSLVDINLCLKLSNNKPELARDMLKMLLLGLPSEKKEINHFLTNADTTAVGEIIHKIYGSSCYCGVPQLKEISGKLDKFFQHKKHQLALNELPVLIQAMDELILWGTDKNIDELFS